MRSPRLRLAALAAAPLLLLAGCSTEGGDGGDESSVTSDDAAVTSAAPEADVSELGATEEDGTPVVTWNDEPLADGDLPFRVSETGSTVVEEGDGATVEAGHEVQTRFIAYNGTTGEQVLSTYDADETLTFDLNNENFLPGFIEGLPGAREGEKRIMALPAADAFGSGNAQLGIGPDDTVVFYLDIVGTGAPLTEATGEEVEPEEGLPEVEADGKSAAVITIPDDAEEPEETVAQVLIKGEGPEVKAGQTLKAHYTGVKFSDGEGFDNSYERGEPTPFPIGVGRVIEGWDSGLVGQTVGSRVLLVIPAEEAYGTDEALSDLANETLVFVVDILGAY